MSTMAVCEQCGERFDYAGGKIHTHGPGTGGSARIVDNIAGGKVFYNTGSTRSSDVEGMRYDLISPYGLRALARVYHEGALVHGDRNWEKGQPVDAVINHAYEHLMKHMERMTVDEKPEDPEDHLAKVAWAMFALIHYRDNPNYYPTPPKREMRPGDVDWEETG